MSESPGASEKVPEVKEGGGARRSWKAWAAMGGAAVATAATLVGTANTLIEGGKKLVGQLSSPTKQASIDVEWRFLEVLPLSLHNARVRREQLPWSSVKIVNRTGDRVEVTVEASIVSGKAEKLAAPRVFASLLGPNQSHPPAGQPATAIDPDIRFTRMDFDDEERVVIIWSAKTDRPEPGHTNTPGVKILPKNVVDWDVKATHGAPVAPETLVASLAAWTLAPDPTVQNLAKPCGQGAPEGVAEVAGLRRWLERCHEQLFRNAQGVRVDQARPFLLSKGRETIRLPREVLERGHGNPIEVGLLVGAVQRTLGARTTMRPALFALSEKGSTALALAWSMPFARWDTAQVAAALDVRSASTLSFQDSDARATSIVVKLLKERPEIAAALDTQGVFVDKARAVVALDFDQAIDRFGVRALP